LAPCPTLVPWSRVSIPPPSPLLVSNYSLCFSVLLEGWGSVCPGAALYCGFTQATLETAGKKKWPTVFSVVWYREAFHGLKFQDIAEFHSD
jgi:hypothetical protein